MERTEKRVGRREGRWQPDGAQRERAPAAAATKAKREENGISSRTSAQRAEKRRTGSAPGDMRLADNNHRDARSVAWSLLHVACAAPPLCAPGTDRAGACVCTRRGSDASLVVPSLQRPCNGSAPHAGCQASSGAEANSHESPRGEARRRSIEAGGNTSAKRCAHAHAHSCCVVPSSRSPARWALERPPMAPSQ
jgi:hypothetical protein